MRKLLAITAFLATFGTIHAQSSYPVEKGQVLFDGYDPITYFDQAPMEGKERYAFEIDGRLILFATKEHLDDFQEDPDKYLPAYGGWCAIAMADKTFIVPDYSLYKIQDGRLMFFAIRAFFNGLTEWNKNPQKNQIKADTNYVMFFP